MVEQEYPGGLKITDGHQSSEGTRVTFVSSNKEGVGGKWRVWLNGVLHDQEFDSRAEAATFLHSEQQRQRVTPNPTVTIAAARQLFDNRMGHGRANVHPHAPSELWADLGAALYGEEDERVQELRKFA